MKLSHHFTLKHTLKDQDKEQENQGIKTKPKEKNKKRDPQFAKSKMGCVCKGQHDDMEPMFSKEEITDFEREAEKWAADLEA